MPVAWRPFPPVAVGGEWGISCALVGLRTKFCPKLAHARTHGGEAHRGFRQIFVTLPVQSKDHYPPTPKFRHSLFPLHQKFKSSRIARRDKYSRWFVAPTPYNPSLRIDGSHSIPPTYRMAEKKLLIRR